jgi:hypothetical protein
MACCARHAAPHKTSSEPAQVFIQKRRIKSLHDESLNYVTIDAGLNRSNVKFPSVKFLKQGYSDMMIKLITYILAK